MNEKELNPPKWFRVVGRHLGYGIFGTVILGAALTIVALMIKLVVWAWGI